MSKTGQEKKVLPIAAVDKMHLKVKGSRNAATLESPRLPMATAPVSKSSKKNTASSTVKQTQQQQSSHVPYRVAHVSMGYGGQPSKIDAYTEVSRWTTEQWRGGVSAVRQSLRGLSIFGFSFVPSASPETVDVDEASVVRMDDKTHISLYGTTFWVITQKFR